MTEGGFMYQRTRDLREERDMNQTEIAGYPGMSRTGYSKYEIGENNIISSVLIKLSDFTMFLLIIFPAEPINNRK